MRLITAVFCCVESMKQAVVLGLRRVGGVMLHVELICPSVQTIWLRVSEDQEYAGLGHQA